MSGLDNKEIMSKNLKKYISLTGKERSQIANDLDIPYSTLTDWINGNAYPRIDKVEMLANYFRVMKSDLVEEEGMLREPITNYSYYKNLPIVGTIAAGTPILAENNITDHFKIDASIPADFIIRIKGDSMIDEGILDGDLAFIRHQDTVENGEIAAVLIDDSATLKKFYRNDGTITLIAANKNVPPKTYTNGDIRIMGKLVAVLNLRK